MITPFAKICRVVLVAVVCVPLVSNAAWGNPLSLGMVGVLPFTIGSVGQIKPSALQIVGSLFIKNGNMGVGVLEPLAALKLHVSGNVGAEKYCDRSGANCYTPGAATGGSAGIGSLPGLVMMFANDCPSGWGRYSPITGRMPIGRDGSHAIGSTYDGHGHSARVGSGGMVSGGGNRTTIFPSHLVSSPSFPEYTNLVYCQKQ